MSAAAMARDSAGGAYFLGEDFDRRAAVAHTTVVSAHRSIGNSHSPKAPSLRGSPAGLLSTARRKYPHSTAQASARGIHIVPLCSSSTTTRTSPRVLPLYYPQYPAPSGFGARARSPPVRSSLVAHVTRSPRYSAVFSTATVESPDSGPALPVSECAQVRRRESAPVGPGHDRRRARAGTQLCGLCGWLGHI